MMRPRESKAKNQARVLPQWLLYFYHEPPHFASAKMYGRYRKCLCNLYKDEVCSP